MGQEVRNYQDLEQNQILMTLIYLKDLMKMVTGLPKIDLVGPLGLYSHFPK